MSPPVRVADRLAELAPPVAIVFSCMGTAPSGATGTVGPMTIAELEVLPVGTTLWLITGVFTASRVHLGGVRGRGATRRPFVEAIDTAPGQATGEFSVAATSLRLM